MEKGEDDVDDDNGQIWIAANDDKRSIRSWRRQRRWSLACRSCCVAAWKKPWRRLQRIMKPNLWLRDRDDDDDDAHAYIHTYMHAYIHTYIHTYIHAE